MNSNNNYEFELWENLGKRMDTIISINKKGTPLDVKRTCFKLVNKQINRYAFIFKKSQTTDSIMDMEYDFPDEINETQDYSKADELLEKMDNYFDADYMIANATEDKQYQKYWHTPYIYLTAGTYTISACYKYTLMSKDGVVGSTVQSTSFKQICTYF